MEWRWEGSGDAEDICAGWDAAGELYAGGEYSFFLCLLDEYGD